MVVALVAVLGLIGGTGVTLASWKQSVPLPSGQVITAGDMQLEAVSSNWNWRNASPDLSADKPIADPATYQATPGDVLLGYWQLKATSVGNNFAGKVTLTPKNVPPTSWPAGVTAKFRVSQSASHTAAEVLDPAATGFSTALASYPSDSLTVNITQAGTEPVVVYLVVSYASGSAVPSTAPSASDWRFAVDFQQVRP